jgi:hypothetical protein
LEDDYDVGEAVMGRSYKDWSENLNHDSWDHIGEWAYPKKCNVFYSDCFYHHCEGDAVESEYTPLQEDVCNRCGVKVPDGIKMIALLEKL